jgi:hypothetical protein
MSNRLRGVHVRLGEQRTLKVLYPTSALPPKVDIAEYHPNVR